MKLIKGASVEVSGDYPERKQKKLQRLTEELQRAEEEVKNIDLTYYEEGLTSLANEFYCDSFSINFSDSSVISKYIKEKTFEPESLTGYIMSNKDSVDIDEALDFKFAEIIMKEELGD